MPAMMSHAGCLLSLYIKYSLHTQLGRVHCPSGHMMLTELAAFFDQQARHLLEGRLHAFVSAYDFPMAIHHGDALLVFSSPVDLLERAEYLHGLLMENQVHSIAVTISAVDLPTSPRFRVWVSSVLHDRAGQSLGRNASVNYLRNKRGRYLIEMVHYTELALPACQGEPARQRRIG